MTEKEKTTQEHLSDMDAKIRDIHANLTKANHELVTSMPESTFVKYFLPTFAGEEPFPGKDHAGWIAEWNRICGLQFLPVAIVKDGTDEVLYHVPALFDRHAVDPTAAPRGSRAMGEVVMVAKQLSEHHPAAGERFMVEQLGQYNLIHKASEDEVRAKAAAWNYIFRRYGKPLNKVEIKDGKITVTAGELGTGQILTNKPSTPSAELQFSDDE